MRVNPPPFKGKPAWGGKILRIFANDDKIPAAPGLGEIKRANGIKCNLLAKAGL